MVLVERLDKYEARTLVLSLMGSEIGAGALDTPQGREMMRQAWSNGRKAS